MLSTPHPSRGDTPPLFWKTKPDLIRQMREERRILVSARDHVTEATKDQPRKEHLTVVAGGVVRRSRAETSGIVRDYGALKQKTSGVRKLKFP
jgi:hypothetical protein